MTEISSILAPLWSSFPFFKACFFLTSAFLVTFHLLKKYFNEVVGSVQSIVCCYCSFFYCSFSISRSIAYQPLFLFPVKVARGGPLMFVGPKVKKDHSQWEVSLLDLTLHGFNAREAWSAPGISCSYL